jgi:mono/diheme cytochrome c family protein
MNKRTFFFGAIIGAATLGSCTSNKTELPEPEVATTVVTNTTTEITYTSHVQDIMVVNCTGCHGGSGGVNLNTYTQVKDQADAGRILARAINGSGGTMPPSGLMPQATLDTLQLWLDQGAQQ